MKFFLRPAVWLMASVALLAIACDRDSPSNDGGGSGGAPIVLRGGERLAWDQAALGSTNPSSYAYTMYVDGSPVALTSVSCSSSGTSYTCSSVLPSMSPGRHSLTLVAALGGASSAPSRSLEVNVVVTSTLLAEVVSEARPVAQPRCSGTGPCYRSTELLRSHGLISSPASALNGRILFIVDGRQIQSVSPGALVSTVLLNVESEAARILSIAVPASGQDDRSFVWVTSVETRLDDTRELTITRYRLVEDALGEAAAIVSMTIPNVEPRVVFDNDGHIYIAMPSSGTTQASVLRLMADGTTPRSQSSPLISSVPRELRAVALTREGQLWISSVDGAGRWLLGPMDSTNLNPRVVSVAPNDPQTSVSDITSLAFVREADPAQAESIVLAVAGGRLFQAPSDGSTLGTMQTVPVPRGTPFEVAADDGGIYVLTATLNGGPVVYSLFRLVP